jgi:hypothetical protein
MNTTNWLLALNAFLLSTLVIGIGDGDAIPVPAGYIIIGVMYLMPFYLFGYPIIDVMSTDGS